jgi:hypothetical protein
MILVLEFSLGQFALKVNRVAVVTILALLSFGAFVPSHCFAAGFSYTYWLLNHPDGLSNYQLTVSVPLSLHEYYRIEDHSMRSGEFAEFVTPHALKPVADSLWSIYSDDEDFANGVLTIVHQIPYEASGPKMFPVETIVENRGDCDLFSFIAASIMVAGGLDVVLLYYEEENHMNVGVSLSHEPQDARSTLGYFTVNGESYYMAETTGDHWETGWRVGERPDMLAGASARVITLETAEKFSPEPVSSSFSTPSSLILTLSSNLILEKNTVVISGSITPSLSNESITVRVKRAYDSEWAVLKTLFSDSNGHYSYVWSPETAETYYIKASWSGDTDHAGAESNIKTLVIVPMISILVVVSLVSVTIAFVVFAVSRRGRLPSGLPANYN